MRAPIPQNNDELGYEPSSIATFQGLFTMKVSKMNVLRL
jgi:hypothetical protein